MRANITNYSIRMRSNSAEFSKYLCLSKLVNICCFFSESGTILMLKISRINHLLTKLVELLILVPAVFLHQKSWCIH